MANVANRTRVQAGVPTGGEFAREQKAENDDLAVETPVSDVEEQIARVNAAVMAALRDGTLEHTPTYSKQDGIYTTTGQAAYVNDVPVGRDTEGNRIFLSVRCAYIAGSRTTQDLQEVKGFWTVNLSAGGIRKGDRLKRMGGGLHHFTDKMPDDAEANELAHLPGLNTDYAEGTPKQVAAYRKLMDEISTDMTPTKWMEARGRAEREIPEDRGHKWGDRRLLVLSDADSVERAMDLLRRIKARKH